MTPTSRGRNRLTRALSLTAVLVAISVGIAGPAHADQGDPVGITFTQNGPGDDHEYGAYWNFNAVMTNSYCWAQSCRGALEVQLVGDNKVTRSFRMRIEPDETAYFGRFSMSEQLPAGTYTITGAFRDPDPDEGPVMTTATTNKPAKLVIAPARLTVDLRVETDPHQPGGAVANAQLTGPFVDALEGCYDDICNPPVPEGEWLFTVTDDTGATVVEKKIAAKGVRAQFASFYWHDVPAGTDYTATATFTPVAALARNFTITPATDVLFTSPVAPVSNESDPAVIVPVTEDPPSPSSVPLWLVILWLIVIAALVTTAVTFLVLLRRQSVTASSQLETHIPTATESDNA
jgi:hypothetical protein